MTPNPPIPQEIQQVATAWRANAKEAGMPDDACYVSYDANEERRVKEFYIDPWGSPDYRYKSIEGPAWEMACNYERGPILFWFPEQDIWLLMYQYADGCKRMKGGHSEAVATAEILYTG
tara:strand:- start:127 stop:483 length:357 start_codon:yes stop_codon:yes gene_type:complete